MRDDLLNQCWEGMPPKCGDLEVHFLSPYRVNVLKRRRNDWFSDNPREQTDEEALCECFFVLTRTSEELTSMFRMDLGEWEETIDRFFAYVDPAAWEEFKEVFTGFAERLKAASVTVESEAGKKPEEAALNHAS